jgi:hypothetical protein
MNMIKYLSKKYKVCSDKVNNEAKILDLNKFKNESIENNGLLRFMNFDLHNASLVLRRTVDYDSITSRATKYTSPLTIELVLNYHKRTILKTFQEGVSKFAVLNYIKQELPQKLKEVLNIDVTIKDSGANRKWKEKFSFDEAIEHIYSFSSILERLTAYPFVSEKERRDLAQHVDV